MSQLIDCRLSFQLGPFNSVDLHRRGKKTRNESPGDDMQSNLSRQIILVSHQSDICVVICFFIVSAQPKMEESTGEGKSGRGFKKGVKLSNDKLKCPCLDSESEEEHKK